MERKTEKKIAVVTGASSGLGLAISKRLLANGFLVIGISRHPDKGEFDHKSFLPLKSDLSRPELVKKCSRRIRQKFDRLDLLINNAGTGFFGLHEGIDPDAIAQMINLNLTAPLILTSALLPLLRKAKGHIINISSITAKKPSPMGSAYAASKAGLLHFSNSLFEEVRKAGVKVSALCPDITITHFFDELSFGPSNNEKSYLTPETVAENLMAIVDQAEHGVVTELVIRPQIHSIARKKKKVDCKGHAE